MCALQSIVSRILFRRSGCAETPGPPAAHDDHAGRVFNADRLEQIWLTGIYKHPANESELTPGGSEEFIENAHVEQAAWPAPPTSTIARADAWSGASARISNGDERQRIPSASFCAIRSPVLARAEAAPQGDSPPCEGVKPSPQGCIRALRPDSETHAPDAGRRMGLEAVEQQISVPNQSLQHFHRTGL
jgi:hypothetical protein